MRENILSPILNRPILTNFYSGMGLLLLALVIVGFGVATILRGNAPLDFPLYIHVHAVTFMAWLVLYIYQVNLIGQKNYRLHRRLGYLSILIMSVMLITGVMMMNYAYHRGLSPIPNTNVQQFLMYPAMDLVGLLSFYVLGVVNKHKGVFHKHCMLLATIAIMDPALGRIAEVTHIPPLGLLLHFGLVGLVVLHDRKVAGSIHLITWLGLLFVLLRVAFLFSIGATDAWETLMDNLFG